LESRLADLERVIPLGLHVSSAGVIGAHEFKTIMFAIVAVHAGNWTPDESVAETAAAA